MLYWKSKARQCILLLSLTICSNTLVHAMENSMTTEEYLPEQGDESMQSTLDTTAAPLAPQITSEVPPLQGPDIITLSEDKLGLSQAGDPKVLEIFKQAEKKLDDISVVINQMNKAREESYKNFFDLSKQIADIIQKASFDKGEFQAIFTPVQEQK